MDIYDFFDSQDIAEYCKSINHKFSGIEAAFIVWHSKKHNLEQKHRAWQEIIETYPDEELSIGHSLIGEKALHPFLQHYMQEQKKLLNRFEKSEKDMVFTYAIDGVNGHDCDNDLYYDYNECLCEAKERYSNLCSKGYITTIRIIKRKIHNKADDSDYEMTLTMNVHFEPIDIDEYEYSENDEDDKYILMGFDYLWVKIPTPFKYGDLVTVCTDNKEKQEPMVLSWIPYWTTSEGRDMSKTVSRFLNGDGDFSDMVASFYYQEDLTGEIIHDHGADYLSLEFYRGELQGKQKLLLAIKNYLQNKIYLDDLLRSHSVLLLEDYAKELRNCGKIDEIMIDSGLKDDGDVI